MTPRPHDVARDLAAFGLALAWALIGGLAGGVIATAVLLAAGGAL